MSTHQFIKLFCIINQVFTPDLQVGKLSNVIIFPNEFIGNVIKIGAKCPQLFFVISGYLCGKSFYTNGFPTNGLEYFQYIKKKFLRLAPFFYLCLFISQISETTNMNFSFSNFCIRLFLLHSLNPNTANNILGIEWFVSDIFIIYAIAPFLLRHTQSVKKSLRIFGISIICGIICLIFCNYNWIVQINEQIQYEMFFHTFAIYNQIPVYLLGIVAYQFLEKYKEQGRNKWILIYLVSLMIISISLGLYILLKLDRRILTNSLIAGEVWFLVFLVCMRMLKVKNAFSKIICLFGKNSYEIYLLHILILNYVLNYCNRERINWVTWSFIIVIIAIVSLVVSLLLKKAMRILKTIFMNKIKKLLLVD